MKTTIQWDIADTTVDTGAEAVEFIDEQSTLLNNWGTHAFALWFGPAGTAWSELPLRIDIDPDANAAAIRWLPDGLVAVTDYQHGASIHVLEDSGEPLAEIPAEYVRASIDTAKTAAAEYVDTGQRPASLTWEPAS